MARWPPAQCANALPAPAAPRAARELHGEVLVARLAVVHHPGVFVQALVQAAAQRDVDFLQAPAHAEQRHRRGPALVQAHGQLVAPRIEQVGGQGRLAEVRGLDVGRRAGEQHAIHQRQQARDVPGLRHGEQHRLRPSCVTAAA